MDAEPIDRDEAEQPKPHWGQFLSWPALLLLAWLIYELTAQPALGVAMICFKFGWEDFATAYWLRKRDKINPGRARAIFWLYIASGLWTTAITATVMIFAYAFLASFVQARAPGQAIGPPPHVIGALLTAFIGFGLSAVFTAWSLLQALLFRRKLWLSSAVHHARRANVWPPPDTPGRGNKLMWLTLTTLLLTMVSAVILLAIPLAMVPMGGGPPGLMVIVIIAAMTSGPVLVFVLRDLLTRRVIATCASECWPHNEPWPEDESDVDGREVTEF